MIYPWRIESGYPESVRGECRDRIPDFEVDNEFQNWLEAHEVVINKSWLVTRATRMRIQGALKVIVFLWYLLE